MQKYIYANMYYTFDYMAHKEIRSLITMGDSLGITLPFSWLNYNNVKAGDKVEITTYGTTAEIKLLNDINQSDIETMDESSSP
jgi:hypothetical protein